MKQDKILLFHPGVQHSYQLALAFQEADILKYYFTSFFYKNKKFPYKYFININSIDRYLRKRYITELNQDYIKNIPYYEIMIFLFSRLFKKKPRIFEQLIFIRDMCFDWHISLFNITPDIKVLVGYPGASYYSFRRAKKFNTKLIIDMPIGYYKEAERIFKEEANNNPDYADSITYNNFNSIYAKRVDKELELADFIVVPSEFVRRTLLNHNIPEEKIIKIPYGSNFDIVNRNKIKLIKNDEALKIIFAGQISQRKGIKYLLEAIMSLKRQGYDIKLTLVGHIIGSGKGLKKYQDLYKHINFVSRNDLKKILLEHDLFVFPSLFEGSALIILEALSCGLPVITTENSGAESIIDGQNGYLIPIRDVNSIISKISFLYRRRDILNYMKIRALETVTNFRWNNYREKWLQFIFKFIK
jgi:glycosyltransferase involved in cell wall biosynthesis